MNRFSETVDILGTQWKIKVRKQNEDKILQTVEGYADRTTREIVICDASDDTDYGDYAAFQRKVLRHEIIHAFLFESGLGECAHYERQDADHPEMLVDWMAMQFVKISNAFAEAGAI